VTANRELPFFLEVAAPVPKGDRAQFLIEKLTELGVSAFVPLRCRRSVVHPGDAKIDRMRRYVIESSKQCGRNVLMRIDAPADWTTYCAARDAAEGRWFAHYEQEAASIPRHTATGALRIVVGPEGGFSDDEVELAWQHAWQRVQLGPRILRIETAALALAVLAQISELRIR
jgi:16S rRNA (uracil1498-N3)-methyltransferase